MYSGGRVGWRKGRNYDDLRGGRGVKGREGGMEEGLKL